MVLRTGLQYLKQTTLLYVSSKFTLIEASTKQVKRGLAYGHYGQSFGYHSIRVRLGGESVGGKGFPNFQIG